MTSTVHVKTVLLVTAIALGFLLEENFLYTSEMFVSMLVLIPVLSIISFFERKSLQDKMADGVTVGHFSLTTFLLIFVFGLSLGILRAQFIETKNIFSCKEICVFSGEIRSDPVVKSTEQVVYVKLDGEKNFYDVKVTLPLYPKYEVGERLTLTSKVTPIENFIDDKSKATANFDYTLFMHSSDVGSAAYFPKVVLVEKRGDGLQDVLFSIKKFISEKLHEKVSEPASYIAVGILLGVSEIPNDLRDIFRVSGLSHILVLSGFNIVIVISTVLFIFSFLPLLLRLVLATTLTLLFVLMVGATPSVVRATIMALIALLAYGVGRTYVSRQALIFSLLLVILYDPRLLFYDVSLHLSFLATAGLVYLGEVFNTLFVRINFFKNRKFLTELVAITLATYTVTLPYSMYTFGSFSLYAFLANLLIVPLVPSVMFMSFLVVLLSFISETVSSLFGYIDSLLIDLIIAVVKGVNDLPFSTISFSLSLVTMLVYYVLIIVFVKLYKVSHRDETQPTEENSKITKIISY